MISYESLIEAVDVLLGGEFTPVAVTHVDDRRIKAQERAQDLAWHLLEMIDECRGMRGSPYYSVHRSVAKAD